MPEKTKSTAQAKKTLERKSPSQPSIPENRPHETAAEKMLESRETTRPMPETTPGS